MTKETLNKSVRGELVEPHAPPILGNSSGCESPSTGSGRTGGLNQRFPKTLRIADVRVGQELPSFQVPVTVTSVMATALATRDYQPVHHDLEKVKSLGNETVFTNTHTTAAYLEKLVMQWAGPDAFLKSLKLRLGVPNYAGDEIEFLTAGQAVAQHLGVVEGVVHHLLRPAHAHIAFYLHPDSSSAHAADHVSHARPTAVVRRPSSLSVRSTARTPTCEHAMCPWGA